MSPLASRVADAPENDGAGGGESSPNIRLTESCSSSAYHSAFPTPEFCPGARFCIPFGTRY